MEQKDRKKLSDVVFEILKESHKIDTPCILCGRPATFRGVILKDLDGRGIRVIAYALCAIHPRDENTSQEAVNKVMRLVEWKENDDSK